VKCKSCERENVEGAVYCAFCGAKLDAAAPRPAVPIVTLPTSVESQATAPPPPPPTLPPLPPGLPTAPPPAPPPQMPGVPYPYPPAPAEAPVSGLAVASLILGVLGFVTGGLTSLLGLILGIVALKQISDSEGRVGGHGLAVAGAIVSGASLVMLLLLAAILFPVFARAREKARQTSCLSNLKQISLGVLMYAADYDEVHPMADNWSDAVMPYVKNNQIFICPSAADQTQRSYAYNGGLDQTSARVIPQPALVAMAFDSQPGTNLSGGQDLVVSRHNEGANFAFADGHAKWVKDTNQNTLAWDPLSGSAPLPGAPPAPWGAPPFAPGGP